MAILPAGRDNVPVVTLAWWQLLLGSAVLAAAVAALCYAALVWVWTDGFKDFGPP